MAWLFAPCTSVLLPWSLGWRRIGWRQRWRLSLGCRWHTWWFWSSLVTSWLGHSQERKGEVLSVTGQNSRIFSYRYHCRCADRPAGVMTSRSSLGSSNVAPSFSIVMRGLSGVLCPLFRENHPRLRGWESEVVSLYNAGQLLKPGGEEADPIVCRNNHTPILIHNQLCLIAPTRPLDYLSNGGQTANLCPLEEPFEHANCVWPTTRKDKVMLVCLPVMALHNRYHRT